MPRKYAKGRGTKDVGQRFNRGITSGVTFVTIPSGVTVSNAGITAPSGTIQDGNGYMVAGQTAGWEMFAGVTITKGGASQVFQAGTPTETSHYGFGFTNSIISVVATVSGQSGQMSGTSGIASVTYSEAAGVLSACTIWYTSGNGVALGGCSLSIIAIGT